MLQISVDPSHLLQVKQLGQSPRILQRDPLSSMPRRNPHPEMPPSDPHQGMPPRNPHLSMPLPIRIIRQTPWQNPWAIRWPPECGCCAYAVERRANPNGRFPVVGQLAV